ncbi:hypothetical protein TELCIR_13733 [Teladorsagia circumcincta]|uniref:Sister chromatid cohesion protein DCC1 n=1 Tax=Teladorsagia circumcincta TaxID=45464 RepID=A0A2G9U4L4_TELCI|nr:hypothetical protein TELCIR_13733 [Teladorsagia circumcincta]
MPAALEQVETTGDQYSHRHSATMGRSSNAATVDRGLQTRPHISSVRLNVCAKPPLPAPALYSCVMDNFVKKTPKPRDDLNERSPFAAERNARRIVNQVSKAPTLEDVTALLKVVREEEGVKAEVQQLQFTEKFPLHDYKLVQLPKEVLNVVKSGDKLVFRGDRQDEVVLCTDSSSYFVKEVETSNSLLIVPTLKTEKDVGDVGAKFLTIAPINTLSQHYLELQKIPCVSIHKLRDLLQLNRLPWDWLSNDSPNDTYSMEMLLDHVQMSGGELLRELDEMPVVEHDGMF